jgi:hypothetical protein
VFKNKERPQVQMAKELESSHFIKISKKKKYRKSQLRN